MSLWSDYILEREGNAVIEEGWGFIEFRISPPVCMIHSLYVRPVDRKSGRGSELADRVAEIARREGCTLWSQVVSSMLNATESLKAVLAYGFKVTEAQNGCIILTKDITGEQHG
jgi:GNAT superfamily N-acetyltransferase